MGTVMVKKTHTLHTYTNFVLNLNLKYIWTDKLFKMGIGVIFLLMSFFFSFIFISWRLITLQYCSGFCHILTWISHGFTCVPHPDPPSRLLPHPIPLGLPSAPALSTCLMHPTWAGNIFANVLRLNIRRYCFSRHLNVIQPTELSRLLITWLASLSGVENVNNTPASCESFIEEGPMPDSWANSV